MKYWKLILKSLFHHWHLNLALLAGSILCTGIITGALGAGDSVRYSLERMTAQRLGQTHYALFLENRFFRKDLDRRAAEVLQSPSASLLSVRGISTARENERGPVRVEVLGVDKQFWELAENPSGGFELSWSEAVINSELAATLGVTVGAELLVRVENKEILPADTPLTLRELYNRAFRVTIKYIAPPDQFGNFSLANNQIPPRTIFVAYDFLAQKLALEGYANLLLAGECPVPNPDQALKQVLTLDDLQLGLRNTPVPGEYELFSRRLFIEEYLQQTAMTVFDRPAPLFSYLVNELKGPGGSTPYSFVAGLNWPGPGVPPQDEGIIVNSWLAEDLGLEQGSLVELAYYTLQGANQLTETTASFRVENIIPPDTTGLDRSLMPFIPGISDEQNCRDWNSGMPINLKKIRPKDEAYWNKYGGTPKAFITYKAAEKLWKNRFGNCTALRFTSPGIAQEELAARLLASLEPGRFGFTFRPVAAEGARAGKGAVDFGQLFLGLSFFLIIACLLLLMLLYRFSIESRADQIGLLLALGYPEQHINYIFLAEGWLLALAGGAGGVFWGIGYTRLVILALRTVWIGAVHTPLLLPAITPVSACAGLLSGFLLSGCAMLFTLRRQIKIPVHLLQGDRAAPQAPLSPPGWGAHAVPILITTAALVMVAVGSLLETYRTGCFFISGTLLLIGIICACDLLMRHMYRTSDVRGISLFMVGLKNYQRSRYSLLTILALTACSLFLIISVGINRQDVTKTGRQRSSGTGGFDFYLESAVPLMGNLSDPGIRRRFGLDEKGVERVSFVQFMLKEGDDASCLNLNRVQNVRIAGVEPEQLAGPGAFSFVKSLAPGADNPWMLLEKEFSSPADQKDTALVPVIADQTVITWSFQKKVGDTLSILDEQGQPVQLLFAAALEASLFQGTLLMSESNFKKHFPSAGGYRIFLAELTAPNSKELSPAPQEIREQLTRLLGDFGMEITPALERLAAFKTVENTYLSIFLALGALALVLGLMGMGIVILRTGSQRKSETALLLALGYPRRALYLIQLAEYGTLFLLAAAGGIIAGLTAVMPSLAHSGTKVPYQFISATLGLVICAGLGWILLGVIWSVPGKTVEGLRAGEKDL